MIALDWRDVDVSKRQLVSSVRTGMARSPHRRAGDCAISRWPCGWHRRYASIDTFAAQECRTQRARRDATLHASESGSTRAIRLLDGRGNIVATEAVGSRGVW